MGRPKVTHLCAGCGKPTPRRGRATEGVRCVECSVDRHEEAARQINAGEGPFYDKWLAGMEKAVTRGRARGARASAGGDASGQG